MTVHTVDPLLYLHSGSIDSLFPLNVIFENNLKYVLVFFNPLGPLEVNKGNHIEVVILIDITSDALKIVPNTVVKHY